MMVADDGIAGPPPAPAALPGVGALTKVSWGRFAERWTTLLGLSAIPWALLAVAIVGGIVVTAVRVAGAPTVPVGLSPREAIRALLPLFGVIALGMAIVSPAIVAAMVYTVGSDTRVTFGAAFRWGWRRWLSMVGVFVLLGLVALPFLIVGGSLLFQVVLLGPRGIVASPDGGPQALGGLAFLLILLAGVAAVFGVRLTFTQQLVALNETTVGGAFRESWRLTRGRFWAIFWRVSAFGVLVTAITAILRWVLDVVGSTGQGGTIFLLLIIALLTLALEFVAGTLTLVYGVVLLRAVQRVAGPPPSHAS